MASKDPAFLFYSGDFLIGTSLFTDEETGQYIKILCYMHQHGGTLCPDDLSTLFPVIPKKVLGKFKKEENGCYYHERLTKEMDKRKNYTESRRRNRKSEKVLSKVYLIQDLDTGYFKIGASIDPERRLIELKNHSRGVHVSEKRNYKLIFYSEDIPASTEFDLQTFFRKQVVRGEWFDLSNDDILYIKNTITGLGNNHMINHMGNGNENDVLQESKGKESLKEKPLENEAQKFIAPKMQKVFIAHFPKYPKDDQNDFPACLQIAYLIADSLHIERQTVFKEQEIVLTRWGEIMCFIVNDKWFKKRSLHDISNEWQRLIQSYEANAKNSIDNQSGGSKFKPLTGADKLTASLNSNLEKFGKR